jgi:Raf kinase inhibitor-like YbhB/YbcL family protein
VGLNIKDLRASSPAIENGGRIPDKYTKYHENVVPPIEWSGLPEGTRQLALVCHDPDAPLPHGFTHWVVYGIPADSKGIPEGGGDGYTSGTNSFGEVGWGGPMPPPGHGAHHYYFWVYALDTEVDAGPGLSHPELLERIEDHIIEQARFVGTYDR